MSYSKIEKKKRLRPLFFPKTTEKECDEEDVVSSQPKQQKKMPNKFHFVL